MKIVLDDLKGAEIAQLLREHLEGMSALTPPASVHVLNSVFMTKEISVI